MARKKVEETKEELVVCEACGKKHLATLDVCPKCGYSVLDNKKTFYDEEDEEVSIADEEEEYDDEDLYEEKEEAVLEKKEKTEKKKVKEEQNKEQSTKEEKKKAAKQKEKAKKEEKKAINKRIKNNKKEKYIVDRTSIVDQNEDLFNFIKIIICIILLVVIFYLIYAFASGEFKKEKDTTENEVVQTIQNEKILASSIFTKLDEEYLVLIYDTTDAWADYYTMVYEDYRLIDNEEVLPIYIVDLSNRFNKDIIAGEGEKTNPEAQKYSELKVSNPTMIRVKDGKLGKYYEGDKVVDKLTREINKYKED